MSCSSLRRAFEVFWHQRACFGVGVGIKTRLRAKEPLQELFGPQICGYGMGMLVDLRHVSGRDVETKCATFEEDCFRLVLD